MLTFFFNIKVTKSSKFLIDTDVVNCEWGEWNQCREINGIIMKSRTREQKRRNGGNECEGSETEKCEG